MPDDDRVPDERAEVEQVSGSPLTAAESANEQPNAESSTAQPADRQGATTTPASSSSSSNNASSSMSSNDDALGALGCLGFILFIAACIYLGFANNFRKDTHHTEEAKWAVYLTPGIFLLALIVVGAIIYFRPRSTRVARMTDIFGVVIASLLAGLTPVLLLGPWTQQVALRLAGIFLLSILPASLYFLFLAIRGRTLWEEFVYNLRRLDAFEYGPLPDLAASDPKNPYRQKFQALYGKQLLSPIDGRRATVSNETLAPVLLCTIVLSLGWAAVLHPPAAIGLELHSFTVIRDLSQGLPATALKYGFVGSYFFALQMIVRRYFQDDLRTAAYVNVMVRIVVVSMLVSVVHLVWPSSSSSNIEWAFAFFIGIFPQVGLQVIRTAVARALGNDHLLPSLRIDYPLSRLDGLNFWYEARLLEAGIEDMQNLATANIVDVILNTRIPVGRLVDWLDQALLYIRLDEKNGKETQRALLKSIGIRSATDFVTAVSDPDCGARFRVFIDSQLDGNAEEGKVNGDSVPRSLALQRSLEGEPNLVHVQAWRSTHDPTHPLRNLTTVLPASQDASIAEVLELSSD